MDELKKIFRKYAKKSFPHEYIEMSGCINEDDFISAVQFYLSKEEQTALEFAEWLNQHGYEPMAMFPLATNRNWSCDDGETSYSTQQLFNEFKEQQQ